VPSTCETQADGDDVMCCHMLPLIPQQCDNSLTAAMLMDVVNMLLSLAYFTAANWQSSLTHLQSLQTMIFYPFSCYLKGNSLS